MKTTSGARCSAGSAARSAPTSIAESGGRFTGRSSPPSSLLGGTRKSVVVDATVHESPPEAYLEYRSWFEEQGIPWSLRVLHPALGVAIDRDVRREGWHAGRERVSSLYAKFTGSVFDPECFVDTSHDTPEETVRRLLGRGAAPPSPR